MYRMIDSCGDVFPSNEDEFLIGNRRARIYGRPNCPSLLHTVRHRIFFDYEEKALAAGCRPCAVCMKTHYELWKANRLMTHAVCVRPHYAGPADICTVFLANGDKKRLNTLKTPGFPGDVIGSCYHSDLAEYRIEGNFCIVSAQDEAGYWGRVIAWDYVCDHVACLVSAPFVRCSTVFNGRVISMYLTNYWYEIVHMDLPEYWNSSVSEMTSPNGTLWYSVTPLGVIDPEYEPDLCLLPLPVPDCVSDEPDCLDIQIEGSTLVFRAGTAEHRINADAL